MTATVHHLPSDMSNELEADFIAALMWAAPAERGQLLRLVHTGDYLAGKHRTMHEALTRLHSAGIDTIDFNAVVDELERHRHLEHVGGPAAVYDVGKRHVGNGRDIAQRLVDRSQRRQIAARARDLSHQVDAGDIAPSNIVHGAVADLLAISRRREGGIVTATDTAPQIRERIANGAPEGWRSGWTNFDVLYRPLRGQLSVVTGVPSHGKSTWVDALLLRYAHRREGSRFAFFSPERETVEHQLRLISTALNVAEDAIPPDRVEDGIGWLAKRFAWLDDQADATLDSIVSRARLEDDRRGLDGLVIDPWNWVEAGRPQWVTATEWIGQCLNELVRLAQERDLHVWVVAHPTKVRAIDSGPDQGKYLVPRPYDISDSANWFNKPWFCLSVWRDHLAPAHNEPGFDADRDPALVDVHVQKVRTDHQGKVGRATFRFDLRARTYAPVLPFGGAV